MGSSLRQEMGQDCLRPKKPKDLLCSHKIQSQVRLMEWEPIPQHLARSRHIGLTRALRLHPQNTTAGSAWDSQEKHCSC